MPLDASRMQREIQMAVSSQERGKAGRAAQHILDCASAEATAEANRQRAAEQTPLVADPRWRDMVAANDRLLPSCQAVDAASRAQLVPLLRRSLTEGDKGAAAHLAAALLEAGFKVVDEPAVVAALRRDAWDCDRMSLGMLNWLASRHPQLLTPNELGALREQQRAYVSVEVEAALRTSPDNLELKAAMDHTRALFKPPPGADPAKVARMAVDIQSRCKVER
ncbi:MAG: hypothetical protein EOP39_11220 [Rubrivivax sp.]|nr:MAG: hypothetical protein EOP39_11220 [Rubrivivax sp.]